MTAVMPSRYQEYSRQQSADRVREAWASRTPKQTRKGRMGASRRALATTGAMMAWMIRLFGGGGGV